jgi:hypothetical protein
MSLQQVVKEHQLRLPNQNILCGCLPFNLKKLHTFQLSMIRVVNFILSQGIQILNNTTPAAA